MPSPNLNYLVVWALPSMPGDDNNERKDAMQAQARTWYEANEPTLFPNSINAMVYAYLLSLWNA